MAKKIIVIVPTVDDTTGTPGSAPVPTSEVIESTEEKIKVRVKNKRHPNEVRYCGKMNHDLRMALLKFLSGLSGSQMAQYEKGSLVLDPVKTKKFISDLKKGDVVGVEDSIYEILSKGSKSVTAESKYTKVQKDFSLAEIDNALAKGFAEILYRDNKPYGIEEYSDVDLVIKKEKIKRGVSIPGKEDKQK